MKPKTPQPTRIEPYDTLIEVAPSVYCLDGDWEETPFRRRMTLLKLKSGGLVVHSAIQLRNEDYAQIDALGKVEYIVVPNAFHHSDVHHFATRYPHAKVFAPKAAVEKVRKSCEVHGVLPEAWSPKLREEIGCIEFDGTRGLSENVFFHRPTKTLLVTDLVFNMQKEVSGILKLFFQLNRIYKRFGPSRIFRYGFVNHPKVAAESFHEIMHWDFDRVIMSHGEILNTGGKEALKKGFEEIGLG